MSCAAVRGFLTAGDRCENATDEAVDNLYNTELIHRRGVGTERHDLRA